MVCGAYTWDSDSTALRPSPSMGPSLKVQEALQKKHLIIEPSIPYTYLAPDFSPPDNIITILWD